MITGCFVGLSSSQLATMQTEWLNCLSAIAANQSYSMSGRSFTRADLAQVRETLSEINHALSLANGTLTRFVHADMSN
jgi:hypothetical protein